MLISLLACLLLLLNAAGRSRPFVLPPGPGRERGLEHLHRSQGVALGADHGRGRAAFGIVVGDGIEGHGHGVVRERVAAGGTVIMTTHILEVAERMGGVLRLVQLGRTMPDKVRYFVWRQNGRPVAFRIARTAPFSQVMFACGKPISRSITISAPV